MKRFSSKGLAVPKQLRDILAASIRRLRTAIDTAAKYRRTNPPVDYDEKCVLLRKDILNSPSHVFSDHSNCEAYFCTGAKKSETNIVPSLMDVGLFQDITSIINSRLALNVKS